MIKARDFFPAARFNGCLAFADVRYIFSSLLGLNRLLLEQAPSVDAISCRPER